MSVVNSDISFFEDNEFSQKSFLEKKDNLKNFSEADEKRLEDLIKRKDELINQIASIKEKITQDKLSENYRNLKKFSEAAQKAFSDKKFLVCWSADDLGDDIRTKVVNSKSEVDEFIKTLPNSYDAVFEAPESSIDQIRRRWKVMPAIDTAPAWKEFPEFLKNLGAKRIY